MVPAIVATADAAGVPNVTFLSRVHLVDDERVALSNQFFSKTAHNLAENPRASVTMVDPVDYRQFRLSLRYERTERRGPVFDRLREDVELIAALSNMSDIFCLRAADIYRVVDIEEVPANTDAPAPPSRRRERLPIETATDRLGELMERLGRSTDADTAVDTALRGLDDLFALHNSVLSLLDESGRRLFTIASHGYPDEGVGSEIELGDGILGMCAERGTPIRRSGVRQMDKYSRRVRTSFENRGLHARGDIPVPRLARVDSQLAVPAMAFGELIGVLMVESTEALAYDAVDESHLLAVASVLAHALEAERSDDRDEHDPPSTESNASTGTRLHVRHYLADGSIFLDGDYLIRGVAGRALWHVLVQHRNERRTEFTNKELRLDPALGLPQFRDNLDSRLLLLKRRLDERNAPLRITKTGRGRFRLDLDGTLRLEEIAASSDTR
jgi:adenylate cyclase